MEIVLYLNSQQFDYGLADSIFPIDISDIQVANPEIYCWWR